MASSALNKREVDVAEADDPAVAEVAGRGHLLGDGSSEILRGDHRVVFGAGDVFFDVLATHAIFILSLHDALPIYLGLVLGEVLDGGVGDRVGPGQLAAGAGAGGVA